MPIITDASGTPVTPERPMPGVDYAHLASLTSSLVIAVGGLLVLGGLATTEAVSNWASAAGFVVLAAGGVLAYVLPLVQARKAAQFTTPVSNPMATDAATGKLVPLVPSTVDLTE